MENWNDLLGVLIWIAAGGGSVAIVNYGLSLIVENWPRWHDLPRFVKFIAPLLTSILLAVGAQFALDYGQDIIEIAQPWWLIIVNAALAYFGSQKAYMTARNAGYARSATER